MKQFIADAMYRYLSYRKYAKYVREYREMLRINGIPRKARSGEDAFLRKWKPLCKRVNLDHYRLFAAYIGDDPNIIPEDISCNIVEPLLNPRRMVYYYEDKNTADRIFPTGFSPRTLLRRIGGAFFDGEYRPVSDDKFARDMMEYLQDAEKGIVLKPSVGTSSGVGVRIFRHRPAGGFADILDGQALTPEFLRDRYGDDFIVQEYLPQSDFMARFNSTSVNTLRMLVYRSVKTNSSHSINTVLRIGRQGSVCDNSHMGGATVGVSASGRLGKYLISSKGEKSTVWNGIDFASSEFVIPNFDAIKAFAERVGDCIPHHRCLNLDVMLDAQGTPRLLEVNYDSMGIWLYQFTNGSCFGEYTDEIIEYCIANKQKLYKSLHLEIKCKKLKFA